MLCNKTYSYCSCEDINIAEAYDGILTGIPLALNCEYIGITIINLSYVCNDPLASAIRLEHYSSSDDLFKLLATQFDI